jgi:hypothetical protein
MEIAEKKVYPSQVNSKTISTRIPAGDYVKFLQESIEKGINISDWLLIKIYSEKSNEKISGLEENVIEISYKDIENYITEGESDFDDSDMIDIRKRAKTTFDFWRQYQDQCFDEDLNTFTFSEENIISIMNQGQTWYSMAMAKNKKEPSLIDVRFQVIQLLNRKNFSKADRNSFLADFDELMEDIK